jgi:hypothetical protein
LAAKVAFYNAYAENNNVTIIHALDQAVTAAQNKTSHIILGSEKIRGNILNDKVILLAYFCYNKYKKKRN